MDYQWRAREAIMQRNRIAVDNLSPDRSIAAGQSFSE
jgi:hypothetical protein